jgi:hypothetical protein
MNPMSTCFGVAVSLILVHTIRGDLLELLHRPTWLKKAVLLIYIPTSAVVERLSRLRELDAIGSEFTLA